MVKSSFKTFGFWYTSIATAVGALFCFLALLDRYTLDQKLVLLAGGSFWVFLFGGLLWKEAKLILIDTDNSTISFTNLFTREKAIYGFDQFDGFVELYQPSSGGRVRVLYLVRNAKFIKKVSSFYYSNLDELRTSISPIKYLGEEDFTLIKSLKILFNMKILK